MIEHQIIIPRPGEVRPDDQRAEQYMEDVVLRMYGSAELPQNIRFHHDPIYRTRVFTIQAAHDHTNWLWGTVFWLMMFADFAWFFIGFIR